MNIVNKLFRLLLTVNATSWMWVVYLIKESKGIGGLPMVPSGILYLFVPIVLSAFSLLLSRKLGRDELHGNVEFNLADNDFLPTYLGYFFVSLSAPNCITMSFIFIIVFVFTHLSQTQYFNPTFLFFRYHYYHALTRKGTKIFIIAKGAVIRNKDDFYFHDLRRINDTTYIEVKEK